MSFSTASIRSLAVAALALAAAPALATDDAPPPEEKIDWTEGPATVDLGASLAEVKLPDGTAFADAKGARMLLERMGNPTDDRVMGLIVPKAEDQSWFVIFKWSDTGYVKDDEKDKIDADAILASIREGTEEANEERKKMGVSPVHVVGWAEKPFYDERTHHLVWATLGKSDDGSENMNYNVRVLGRSGVMSVTFVDEPKNLPAAKPAVDAIIAAFSYKQGSRYAEWVPGDKVAEYGLTALVAAGAGAAAAKAGFFGFLAKLLAKSGKLVVLLVAGIGAGIAKFWNALRGKASARKPPADPPA